MRRLAFLVFCAFTFTSCGPSYPKGGVAKSLEDLCWKEHKVKVSASVVNTTIGVMVKVPGIITDLMKESSGGTQEQPPPLLMEGGYKDRAFDFQFLSRGSFVRVDESSKDLTKGDKPSRGEKPKTLETLDHVSMALNRVALSTDAKLDFYVMVVRDPEARLDLIYSGHLGDLKQVQYWAISRSELQRRSKVTLRHPPEDVASDTVREFLEDLSQETILQLLSRYAAFSTRFGELLPKILQLAVELQGNQQFLVTQRWPVRQVGEDTVLVYVTLAPVNDQGALLFTVQLRDGRGYLADIERLPYGVMPERYKEIGAPDSWGEFFFLQAIDLAGFLSEQITKRVLSEFKPVSEQLEQKPSFWGKKEKPQPVSNEEVAKTLVQTSAYVLNSYKFQDFDELRVTNALDGNRWKVNSKDLPLYRGEKTPELKSIP